MLVDDHCGPSLRFNLGADVKRVVMEKVADFKINHIAQSRIKKMWTKVKNNCNLKKQAETRAKNIRQQAQFNSTSKFRINAQRKVAAAAAANADGEYVDCKNHAKQIEKETRKSLRRKTK